MKSLKYNIWIALSALILFSGCKESWLYDPNRVEEGVPTTLYLRLNTSNMNVVTRAEASDADEQRITSLYLFVFDSTGNLISSNEHSDINSSVVSGTVVGQGGIVALPTLTGNDRAIYAIANYDANTIEDLKSVSEINDLKRLMIQNLGNPLIREFGFCKVGVKSNVNIREGQTIDMTLSYISSKITINVENETPDFEPTGWTVAGFPLKTYLLERSKSEDPNYHDAANINNPDDYYNEFSDQSFPFDEVNSAEKKYKSVFYTFENRRGGRDFSKGAIPDGWPNGTPDNTPDVRAPYQEKAWYAPKNATYIRIYGKNLKDPSRSKALTITHYLGENNYDNYDIERACHYTYTIRIKGLNNISIDTNIEQSESSLSFVPPAGLMNLDAHADNRLFYINTSHITEGVVSIEVVSNINSLTDRPAWLKVAPFPLEVHQIKSSDPDIALWQQDGIDGYYVRTRFIPHRSKRTETGYTHPNGVSVAPDLGDGSPDLTKEYPNNDDMLPLDKAMHRMCYKITDIPVGISSQLYLHIDEFEYSQDPLATDFREAYVRITYDRKDGSAPEYTHYKVRQYRPISFTGLPFDGGVDNMMVVERVEEFQYLHSQVLPMYLQLLTGMQWGKYDLTTTLNNGYLNTLRGVYQSVTASPLSWNPTQYLPKYGSAFSSTFGSWPTADNGKITEPATISNGGIANGAPFFNFNVSNFDFYHSTYNSTAARYCHEKNFDIDGDGNISPSETKWYLPALQELQLFWTYRESLSLDPEFYWSSTQSSTDQAYAISMMKSVASPHLVYNGTQQPVSKTVSGVNPPRVRCVRRVTGTPLRPIIKRQINEATVIDCSNMPGSMYTTESKNGITQQNVDKIELANTQVYKKFQVQTKQPAPTSYSELHAGSGKCNVNEGWRLPTQREMLLIWSVRAELESDTNFDPFPNTDFWTMSRGLDRNYVIDFTTGLSKYVNLMSSSSQLNYRCIREMP